MMTGTPSQTTPLLQPLGDRGLLVKFGNTLSDEANIAAIQFAEMAEAEALPGVTEIVPNLVSVLLRYDPREMNFARLAGEVRLLASRPMAGRADGREELVEASFDGEDVSEVADALGMSVNEFVCAHNRAPLRVLATGFAPGFVYCGMHATDLLLPRRQAVRDRVPAGTVLFAAGQTAITSTAIPTGWHVIGQTAFRNFDPAREPPVALKAGDRVRFAVV